MIDISKINLSADPSLRSFWAQVGLKSEGYYLGELDNDFGNMSREALDAARRVMFPPSPSTSHSVAFDISKLDPEYRWLGKVDGLPNTIRYALAEYGVAEVVGRGSNQTIIAWRDELNQAGVVISGFSDDDIAWCGLFAAIIIFRRVGNPAEVVTAPLWARNWAKYGVRADKASLGDVLVFERGNGGHVGFYVGEDALYYHVLGGNQSNKVCILRLEKKRCLAVRRPPYNTKPAGCRPFSLRASGEVSKNEV